MELITVLVLLALLVFGLERNHARQAKPRPRLAGLNIFGARDTSRTHPILSP